MFRFLGFLAIAALAISIAGDDLGTDLAHPSQAHTGMILRRAAAIIFGFLWVLLVFVHIGCWTYRYYLRSHRRRVWDPVYVTTTSLLIVMNSSLLALPWPYHSLGLVQHM